MVALEEHNGGMVKVRFAVSRAGFRELWLPDRHNGLAPRGEARRAPASLAIYFFSGVTTKLLISTLL